MSLTVQKYYELRDLVQRSKLGSAALASASGGVYLGPVTGNLTNVAWEYFGAKPLFAWGSAVNNYSNMWHGGLFPSFVKMAGPAWGIQYKKISGSSWNSAGNWMAVGNDVTLFRSQAGVVLTANGHTFKRPQVSLQRLYNMRRVAENIIKNQNFFTPALSSMTSPAGDFKNILLSASTAKNFLDVGDQFSAMLGLAVTTAFHGLCDLNYQVIKPDMHAARSLIYFHEVNSGVNFNDPNAFLKKSNLNKAEVVCAAVKLARQIKPLPAFVNSPCREVDVVLLWGSRDNHIIKLPRLP